MRSFVGKALEAITLRSCGAGTPAREGGATNDFERGFSVPEEVGAFTEALTDNYLKLHLKGCHEPNRWLRCRVERVDDGTLVASQESARELTASAA